MVSSTWFSAESNLDGKKNKDNCQNSSSLTGISEGSGVLTSVLTCWCEAAASPAVAFLQLWPFPPPLSAARVRPRLPAETPEWPQFVGTSPADAWKSRRKKNKQSQWFTPRLLAILFITLWLLAIGDARDTAVVDSLALFWLKQASLYEVGHRLDKDEIKHKFSRKFKLACALAVVIAQHWSFYVVPFKYFYLVAVLEQHSSSWELVDGVKVKSARWCKVWSLWDFLMNNEKL